MQVKKGDCSHAVAFFVQRLFGDRSSHSPTSDVPVRATGEVIMLEVHLRVKWTKLSGLMCVKICMNSYRFVLLTLMLSFGSIDALAQNKTSREKTSYEDGGKFDFIWSSSDEAKHNEMRLRDFI